jgi:holo-[acyl-carrier protein] synthase
MILGVGTDLTSVEKIAASVRSQAFRRKVFTPAEIAACEAFGQPAEHYAGKFAAKEACMKALSRGIRQSVWFTHIEVLNRETGAPVIRVSGEAERAAKDLGVRNIHVSISHSQGLALAVVILEGE